MSVKRKVTVLEGRTGISNVARPGHERGQRPAPGSRPVSARCCPGRHPLRHPAIMGWQPHSHHVRDTPLTHHRGVPTDGVRYTPATVDARHDTRRGLVTTASLTFGMLLRRHRLAAGLTQEALAERAGLSTRGVQDLERGIRQVPRAETVRLLADALALEAAARTGLIAAAHPELAAPPMATFDS